MYVRDNGLPLIEHNTVSIAGPTLEGGDRGGRHRQPLKVTGN